MTQRTLPAMRCALATLLALAACSTPTNKYASEKPTEDGLYLIRSAPSHNVYLRPGARIQNYTAVVVDPFMVSYAMASDVGDAGPAQVRTLDPEAEARLTSTLRDAFIQEMKRSRYFRLVEAPGPEVLRVQGWIYELVIDEPYRGDPRNFPLCFGTMNLILAVRDSLTAQALARVSHRIAVSCELSSNRLFYTASWLDTKRAFRPWASFLRVSLDELHEIPDLPAAPGEQQPLPVR